MIVDWKTTSISILIDFLKQKEEMSMKKKNGRNPVSNYIKYGMAI